MQVDIKWLIGFLLVWVLVFGVAVETGSPVLRVIEPIVLILFITYLFVATMMALFTKKKTEEKESDVK